MTTGKAFRGQFARMAQLGQSTGVQVVSIAGHIENNRYTAIPQQFDSNDRLIDATDATLEVVNLAEPETSGGQVASGIPTVAVDVEGQWVVYARPFDKMCFVAEVASSLGDGVYSVSPMDPTEGDDFTARGGTVNAINLWEEIGTTFGSVIVGTYVLVSVVEAESDPATIAYVFSHPPTFSS